MVTLEHAIAAPFCTRQLADLGAHVIKVERPGVGDFARAYDSRVNGLASHFVWTNRTKESLTLDVKHDEAQQILHKLLADVDVDVLVQALQCLIKKAPKSCDTGAFPYLGLPINTEAITHEALSLPVQQRAELAAQLLSSLDVLSEAEIEPLWFQVAAQRAVEMDLGLSKRIAALMCVNMHRPRPLIMKL